MDEVAAVYTVPRSALTPLEVLADPDGARAAEDRPERPRVRLKRVWASVERDPLTVIEETLHEARAAPWEPDPTRLTPSRKGKLMTKCGD